MNKFKGLESNGNIKTQTVTWKKIDWYSINKKVLQCQYKIYATTKAGDIKKVRQLQHQLLNSFNCKLLAVQRITQDFHTGKATAGFHGYKFLTLSEKIDLATSLKIPMQPSPPKRLRISKSGMKKRLLKIPTLKDQALQVLFKLAMEPEWEARFEPNSYGFRPGRGCHAAIKQIYFNIKSKANYVIDADIAKCFDRINQKVLLDKVGFNGKLRKQLQYWLKSGILDSCFSPKEKSQGAFFETYPGIPKGEGLSPLLTNIALHGLENHLKRFLKDVTLTNVDELKMSKKERIYSISIVRYADDFVIFHPQKETLLLCFKEVEKFLSLLGLDLSLTQMRLTHTFKLNEVDTTDQGFDGKIGFDFLGFTFKQFSSKNFSVKNAAGIPLGFKTLIYPSAQNRNLYQAKLHRLIFKKGKNLSQSALIQLLNPVIRRWATYFGVLNASPMRILTKIDHLLYLKLRRLLKNTKRPTGKGTSLLQLMKVFPLEKRKSRRKGVLTSSEGNVLLPHSEFSKPLTTYRKVLGESSLFSKNETKYCLLNKKLEVIGMI